MSRQTCNSAGLADFRHACVQLHPLEWAATYSFVLRYCTRRRVRAIKTTSREEILLRKIARRQFIQLSAVAAAGCLVRPGSEARAQDLPQLTEDDAMAQAMKYTHDSTTVDPASRANPAPDQLCANCALVQGDEAAEWRPCQIFPGKLVNNKGWCSVWAPNP